VNTDLLTYLLISILLYFTQKRLQPETPLSSKNGLLYIVHM